MRAQGDLTRKFHAETVEEDQAHDERLSGKGDLTRKRTVRGAEAADDSGLSVLLDVDESVCLRGACWPYTA